MFTTAGRRVNRFPSTGLPVNKITSTGFPVNDFPAEFQEGILMTTESVLLRIQALRGFGMARTLLEAATL
jgi:hypothetical protein